MQKLLFIALLLTLFNTNLFAQAGKPNNSGQYEYFIRISGINSRQDVEYLQNNISKKEGIIFFMANRYPVRYFLLRSDRVITKNNMEVFLGNTAFKVEFFGAGGKGREEAILIYNKKKAQ